MLHILLLACSDDPTTHDSAPADTGEGPCTTTTFYVDLDGDGFGVDAVEACEQPADTSPVPGDCDDADASVHPDAKEICNAVDDDCDGSVDFDGWLPGDYDSLSHVVEVAPDGAIVCVTGTHSASYLTLERSLTLKGMDATLDAEQGLIFWGNQGVSITLEDMTLTGVGIPDSKGGVASVDNGAATLRRVRVEELTAVGSTITGGLLLGIDSDLTLDEVTVTGASVSPADGAHTGTWGGLVYASGGTVTVRDSALLDSTFEGDVFGLGVMASNAAVDIDGFTMLRVGVAPEYNAYAGVLYSSGDHAPTLRNVTVQDNAWRFDHSPYPVQAVGTLLAYVDNYTETQPTRLENVRIANNLVQAAGELIVRGGALTSGWGAVVAENLVFAGNRMQTLRGGSATAGFGEVLHGLLSIQNADFYDNHVEGVHTTRAGLFFTAGEGGLAVRNTNIVQNGAAGVDAGVWWGDDPDEALPLDVGWLNLVGDSERAFLLDGTEQAVDLLREDPLYVDPDTLDLHLAEGSPMVDAGDPERQDADGSRCDVGAFGGPGGAW